MPWSNHPNITAIIYAGAPGEQAGPSLVDVLWGTRNPSGRLPFSMDDVRFLLITSSQSSSGNEYEFDAYSNRVKVHTQHQSYTTAWASRL
jgi:hypothetical protein